MKFKIQVVVNSEQGGTITEDVITLDKSSDEGSLVGLSLSESKQLLKQLQKAVVTHQAQEYTQRHRCCPVCYKKRRIKGRYDIQYRTLFGIVSIPNTRLYHCHCAEQSAKTFSVPMTGYLSTIVLNYSILRRNGHH